MDALEWIKRELQGFELSDEVRDAATDFFWLWSVFEFKCLGKNASVGSIRRFVEARKLRIVSNEVEPHLGYFRQRYFREGRATMNFESLNFRNHTDKQFVQRCLEGDGADLVEICIALMIIVHRFRNNMFHGSKWEYALEGQAENFQHANVLLKMALKL